MSVDDNPIRKKYDCADANPLIILIIALSILLQGCAGQIDSSYLNGIYERKMILVVADECRGRAGYYKNLGDNKFLICVSTSDYKNFEMIMEHELAHAAVDTLGLPQPKGHEFR